jgi:ketosteroid isomerase-like protein
MPFRYTSRLASTQKQAFIMTQTFSTPQDAEDAYYDALEEGDVKRLLDVWADSDDVCCLLPMYPLVRGRKPVEEAFAHLFSRGQGVTLAISHIDWVEANDMAIHLVEETIQNVPPGQAPPPPFYATNIYTRTADGWRLLVHQNSPMPPPQPQGI